MLRKTKLSHQVTARDTAVSVTDVPAFYINFLVCNYQRFISAFLFVITRTHLYSYALQLTDRPTDPQHTRNSNKCTSLALPSVRSQTGEVQLNYRQISNLAPTHL